MKKLLFSLIIGSTLAGVLYWYCNQPGIGSRPDIALLMVPLQLLAIVLTQNGEIADVVLFGFLVIWFSFGGYLIVSFLDWARKLPHPK